MPNVEVVVGREGPARDLIESRVAERARRNTAEQVQETCSFARAERLLGREYHGRFLIELLQNAADAWRDRGAVGLRSKVRIELTDGPALLVANQGTPFPAAAVIESLGHIGRSTKAHGEAIGHKGIGFKSVLEISLVPELYSGLAGDASLAVRFDPREALTLIGSSSPQWDAHLDQVDDIEDAVGAVPVLRYPMWVDTLPADVQVLVDDGFDTVVRLPFDDTLRPDPHMDVETWVGVVRNALNDITDHMILLLGTFDQVEIVDRLACREWLIKPLWGHEQALADGASRELVSVERNGASTSRWRLYRRTIPDAHGLAGEVAVGLRSGTDDSGLLAAVDGTPSSPFHLFFPTHIASGLPFLLHGYFEVNAARTGFYDGSAARNDAILAVLADLVATAVADTADDDPTALTALADLLGDGGPPEDARAAAFRARALRLLDAIPWVPLEPGDGVPTRARPTELLVDERTEMLSRILAAFSPGYIQRRTGLGAPLRAIRESGHRYLLHRRPESAADAWASLELLLRPGSGGPWEHGEEDARFTALLELIAALHVHDPGRATELLDGLRGDPDSHLLPTLSADGGRKLLPLPDPAEAAAGRRSVLVMARTRDLGGAPIVPPESMDVAFLPDGLLDSEARVDRAKPLGVRDFTVDNILDRMRGVASSDAQTDAVVSFLWALLVRERRSDFSTHSAADRAAEFDPSAWFWCRPGDGGGSGPEAERQRRRRLLADTRLPARDGTWQPAGSLAFGADWAEWLQSGACGTRTGAARQRIAAYSALDSICPSEAALLAPPEILLPYLTVDAFGDHAGDDEVAQQRNRERHAFLLTTGVWEVIPVEAFENRETRQQDRFPWTGPLVEARSKRVLDNGGWRFAHFPWSGGGHDNVRIAEDFRFGWSLAQAADRDAIRTAGLLETGAKLYTRLGRLAAFCQKCDHNGAWHIKRYHSVPEDNYPSILALELQTEPWAPATLNGEPLQAPQTASTVWWADKPPAGAGLRQSPLRYLRLVDPRAEIGPSLRALARIPRLDAADGEQIEGLLAELRHGLENTTLVVPVESSNSAKQAYIGLHRLAYERLEELAANDPLIASELLTRVGVLCEIGDQLDFVSPPEQTRHNDGRFAAYKRYFSGHIAIAALARDRSTTASRLGIPPFIVSLQRRPSESTRDVTEDVADILAERVPELLAIVVHHSLGAQTLEPSGQQFEERSRRLRNLRVYQVDDLVIDASVEGTNAMATIGEGSGEDVFLEDATTANPVLYHDLNGEGWKDALKRKLHPHLAAVLENPAYAATFKNLLVADDDAEREEVLYELGISTDDVAAIRSAIGAVSEEERASQQRWFSAIVAAVSQSATLPDLELDHVAEALTGAGLSADVAHQLVEAGGGESARSDASRDGPLSVLVANQVSLEQLDRRLRDADPFDGLSVNVAQHRLGAWLRQHRRRVAAVLAQCRPPDEAKALPDTWKAPVGLRFSLQPANDEWIAPVTDALRAAGYNPDPATLAERPVAELVQLAGLADPAALETLVRQLYDHEERARILRAAAAAWRNDLALLAILVRTRQGDSRAAIRAQASTVDEMLPLGPTSPSALAPAPGELFAAHPAFADALSTLMVDTLSSMPERASLLALAKTHDLDVGHLEPVERALQGPRRELARQLRTNIIQLKAASLTPKLPDGLTARPPAIKPKTARKTVASIKVTPSSDARKRRLGDEGERWALAAVLAELVPLEPADRRAAIDTVVELLNRFEGAPVEKAREHAEPACQPDLDEEELIDELTELLHVSRHSDGFGFDLIGWLRPSPEAHPIALCLEVKSARDGTFHLSSGEWRRALSFHDGGEGERYAILVVHRSSGSGPPKRLDLLVDPVELVNSGQLAKTDDGYKLAYIIR